MRALAAAVVLPLLATAAAAGPRNVDYFPNVPLTTHEGKEVHFHDLIRGKQVAINAIFTSCKDVCPLETANLVQLRKVLGKRVGRDQTDRDERRDTGCHV